MNRNFELEKRIKERIKRDELKGINSYGGMAMDCMSGNDKKIILEEAEYVRNNTELFYKKPNISNKSIYLINLN